MSTLDDLRRINDEHADALHDTEQYVRPAAVRARITHIRRRRNAAVAIAAAVVVVAGAIGVTSLRSSGDDDARFLAGVEVPETIQVYGFPYREVMRTRVFDDHVVKREDNDRDHAAVLVGTGLGSGTATLLSNGQPVARLTGSEQMTAPVLIGDGKTDLRVRIDGAGKDAQVGAVVYEATGELAPGVTNTDGTAVFRDTLAGQPLVAGAFVAPGEDELNFQVSGDLTDIVFTEYCAADTSVFVNVSIDGDGGIASSCGDEHPDAAMGSSFGIPEPTAGGTHDIRVYLTDRDDNEIPADGIDFGAGLYRETEPDQKVAGQDIATRVEYLGRTWVLDETTGPSTSLETGSSDRLLGFAATGRNVSVRWEGGPFDGEDGTVTLSDGGSTYTSGLLLAGETYSVELKGDVTDGALLFYRPVD